MSDTAPAKPHRWFRFHLVTYLVVILVAGGLLGVNLQEYKVAENAPSLSPPPPSFSNLPYRYGPHNDIYYGWPWTAYKVFGYGEIKKNGKVVFPHSIVEARPIPSGIAANAATDLAILACVAIECEMVARRKKAKPAPIAKGRKLREVVLEVAPVSDGLSAADGQLYLVTRNGKITCYGAKQ